MLLDHIQDLLERRSRRAEAHLTSSRWTGPRARERMRRRFAESLGLHPAPDRGDLCVRPLGSTEFDGYRIERLTFEPRPGFVVPALVYVPARLDGRAPAVLFSIGHWMRNAKSEEHAQAGCASLARLGYVAMTMDPIGQGERGPSFTDHGHQALLLTRIAQQGLMVWECLRAIDYLETRPDVDAARIGMTGASGGGLATMVAAAVDERIRTAVPVCYVSQARAMLRVMRGMNWSNSGDLCNQMPGVISDTEFAGICALIAPRPLLVLNSRDDPQIPSSGARHTIALTEPFYADDPSRLDLRIYDLDHGYQRPMREAAYGWFQRWLRGTGDGTPIREPDVATLPPDDVALTCVGGDDGGLTAAAIEALVASRARAFATGRRPAGSSDEVQRNVARVLGLPRIRRRALRGRVEAERTERGVVTQLRRVVVEPGVAIPVTVVRRPGALWSLAVVVAVDRPTDATARADLAGLLKGVGLVYVEPRGMGTTAPEPPEMMVLATLDGGLDPVPPKPGEHLEFETATYLLMAGLSIAGLQAQDVLGAVDHLRRAPPEEGAAVDAIVGSGIHGSLVALISALFEPGLRTVVTAGGLAELASLATVPGASGPPAAYLFGALRSFDLPDLVGALDGRTVIVSDPVDGEDRPADLERVRAALDPASRRLAASGGGLEMATGDAMRHLGAVLGRR
jgi:hypothetical protein